MPPKAARGRGGARGGRGRGGKAPVAAPADDEDPQSHAAVRNNTQEPAATVKADGDLVMDGASHQPSPNSSPVEIPTETPAPTPIRPAMERTTGSRGKADSSRGATSSKALGESSGGAAKSKFKPKIVRRDERSREELKRLAEEKSRKDQEQAAREAVRAQRGRGAPRRGRGDAMGRGTLGRGGLPAGASGPFSLAPDDAKRSGMGFGAFSGPVTSFGGRSGGSGSSFSRVKGEDGVPNWGQGIGRRGGPGDDQLFEPQYPDEDGPRIDIEHINLVSDDDDEPIVISVSKAKGKGVPSKGGLRPVRLDRHEHKARTAVVDTDSSAPLPGAEDEDTKDAVMIDSDDATAPIRSPLQARDWKGVYDDINAKVKPEPDAPMAMDSIPSPESNRTADLLSAEPPKAETASPKSKKVGSESLNKKETKPVIQTKEDKDEYERHLEDVAILANELGGLQAAISTVHHDGSMDVDGEQNEVDQKEGRLYLFQFPPILPPLCHPDNATDEIEMTGATTKESPFAKLEGQEEIVQIKAERRDDLPFEPTNALVNEEGFLGHLIVRESGKVELSWGGTNLVVGRGVETTFLSTVVVMDERKGMDEGVAMGMGQVMGKFVVKPDFESLI